MNVTIIENNYQVKSDELKKVAKAAFSVLGNPDGEVELIFISKNKMAQLNQDYRKINKTTDVLSFEIEKKPLIGQIFICYTKAREQAGESGVGIEGEIEKLFIHGLVHIFGYDHEKENEAKAMRETEQLIEERNREHD